MKYTPNFILRIANSYIRNLRYLRSMSSGKQVLLQSMNIAFFVATLVVNSLAGGTTFLNGKTSGQISDMYPTLITPAGFTFSIWSVIYALLLVFIVYQALPRSREESFLERINVFFALSGLANILWLFLWHYELIIPSVLLMFGLLASLLAVYLRLNVGKAGVSLKERICVHLPFSVYLGWITVASIANVSVALTYAGWDGGGIDQLMWAILVIAVALLITLATLATRKDVAFSLVIIWALIGIIARQADNQSLIMTAEVSIVVILVAIAAVAIAAKLKK